ncbi:hypothetical protein R3P38DRAFT_3469021 [Favolaschia claudopus]|uniref:Uncharacterized protein n=1 Tax=Favolaschia claudopus TaxID=2862362 RepID=A0AAW0CJW6_9AGAR
MFSTALTALVYMLSVPSITVVTGAPVAHSESILARVRARLFPSLLSESVVASPFAPKFCTGINGRGTCKPVTPGECTNTPGIVSLVLNKKDADCLAYTRPDCKNEVEDTVSEFFADDSEDLRGRGLQSVLCTQVAGTVFGFTAGTEAAQAEDKFAQENGFVFPDN